MLLGSDGAESCGGWAERQEVLEVRDEVLLGSDGAESCVGIGSELG
ncbi:hypothetical protein [Anaplasma marginale]|nr:hypothetical protein [Anaplasma marginale]